VETFIFTFEHIVNVIISQLTLARKDSSYWVELDRVILLFTKISSNMDMD